MAQTTDRMIKALTERLASMGITATAIKLYPARGYWRQTKADVMQFTGSAIIDGVQRDIGCWESMTDCLRYGFLVHDERKAHRPDAAILVEAEGRRNIRS